MSPYDLARLPDADSWLHLLSHRDRAAFRRFVEQEQSLKRSPLDIDLAV